MARHGRSFPIKAHMNYQGRTGIYFDRSYTRTLSESVSNGASRLATVARTAYFARSISDSIMNAASRLATLLGYKVGVRISINGVDKTSLVQWESFRKQQVSTKEPDTLLFDMMNYPSKTFRPVLGDEVAVYDEDGITLIFGGTIINTEEKVDGLAKYFSVECKDWTHTLDRKLVVGIYTGQTINYIINDIVTNYTTGFTKVNTTDTTIINKISFNYLTPSECFKKLAAMLGNYSWYVDYTKDVHFYANASVAAPYALTDTSQNFIWNSLTFRSDVSQIRNHIILRGGTTEGTAFTELKIADGKQNTFFVGYDLVSYTFYKALAASPTTFVALTVGSDGVTDPTTVDVLYNPNSGLIRFANSNTPAISDVVKWTGTPTYPLITQKIDTPSVAQFGTYQYVIIDQNIKSVNAASQRMQAELARYAGQVDGAQFITHTTGLLAGQNININSSLRSINQNFKIDRITTRLYTPKKLKYDVDLITTENVTMMDVLNKLLVVDPSDQISIEMNEILQSLYSSIELISLAEIVAVSTSHNMQSETMSMADSVLVQALNYATIFVAGPWSPSSTKRVFVLNGSILG